MGYHIMRMIQCRFMTHALFCIFCIWILVSSLQSVHAESPLPEMDPNRFPAPDTGCLSSGKCHAGLEPIRAHNSAMAKQIYAFL